MNEDIFLENVHQLTNNLADISIQRLEQRNNGKTFLRDTP